jgi:tRNA 2-thiouridine synthesizing protein A
LASEPLQPDIELDFRSLRCPHLLIATIKEIEKAQPDQVLRIIAADLNAPSSIGSWTKQSGHTLLDMHEDGEEFIFLIRCKELANSQQAIINSQQPIANNQTLD